MTVRFSPEAAKREMTPVDNLFFTVYMPEADGMFVKVYLYGLMQCYHLALADESIEDALGLSESDVRCAYVYWQSKGLVRIESDDPFIVEYCLSDRPQLTTATDLKYRPFVLAVNALLAPRQLELREMRALYDCIDVYGLEEATVLELVGYCIEQKGKRVSANYLLATAKTWNERGIITPEQAKAYLEDYRAAKHGASEVLFRWNKRRKPTKDEMDLYDKWTREWGFDEEAILAVCPQLVEVGTPTFAILNDRLEAMHRKQLSTAESIERQSAKELDDREFCYAVFERLGKVEIPNRTDIAQLAMFRREKELPEDVIFLAADACRTADRPFGLMKKILLDWDSKGIRTLDAAQNALAERERSKPMHRKQNRAVTGYAQQPIRDEDIEHMIVDLNEDLT